MEWREHFYSHPRAHFTDATERVAARRSRGGRAMGRVGGRIMKGAAILTWLVAVPAASMAQMPPDAASGFRGPLIERPAVLPPSVVTTPNSAPSSSQHLDIPK